MIGRMWVHWMVTGSGHVFWSQARLAVSEARLAVAVKELQQAQQKLDDKEAELRQVQELYDKAMAEKQALLEDAESCKRKMVAASELIGGLAGEKIRWTNQSKEFKASIDRRALVMTY